MASPNGHVADLVAGDPASAAAFVEAAKSSGYRYVPSALRVPRLLPRSGRFAVRLAWRNDGSAPTYDAWRVTLQLRKRGHAGRQHRPRHRPATVLPGTSTFKRSLTLGKLRAAATRSGSP